MIEFAADKSVECEMTVGLAKTKEYILDPSENKHNISLRYILI